MSRTSKFNYAVYKVIVPLTVLWMAFLWVIDFTTPEHILSLGVRCLIAHVAFNVYLNQRKPRQ